MKKLNYIFLLFFPLLMGSCTKNEFKITAQFDKIEASYSFTVTYHASDPKKGWVVSYDLPVVDGVFQIDGATHDPTVVWFSSSGGVEVTWLLAERGDKLSISGSIDEPLKWKVSGNKTDELLSEWRNENISLLQSAGSSAVNAAVAKFVEANVDSPAATLLLLNTFDRRIDPQLFTRLWKLLKKGAQKEAMLKASGISPLEIEPISNGKITKLTLFTTPDTLKTFLMSDVRATVLGFMHGDEPRRAAVTSFLTSMAAKPAIRSIEISFARDSIFWRHTLPMQYDKSPVDFAWVQGGIDASSLKGLNIGPTPWYIAIDSHGRTVYSGSDSTKVRAAVNKLK